MPQPKREQRVIRQRASAPQVQTPVAEQDYYEDDSAEEIGEIFSSSNRAGHSSSIHPEDQPRTTSGQPVRTRPPEPNHITLTPSAQVNVTRSQRPIEDDEDEDIWPSRQPTSTRRYDRGQDVTTEHRQPVPSRRTATMPAHATAQQQSRAIAHIQQAPSTVGWVQEPRMPRPRPVAKRHVSPLVYLGLSMTLICIGAYLAVVVPPWWNDYQNDKNYGNPRTYQINYNVGHGGMSHFTAQNLDGTIDVSEIVLGNNPKPKLYPVTILSGPGAEKYPVIVKFVKIGNKVTMIVDVNNTEYDFDNTGSAFTPHK